MPADAERFRHRPPLGAHRLLGQGLGAALLRPDGEVDWWCPDDFHATPVLWSLLDEAGGTSRWLDVELATWDARPAGPTARSIVRCAGQRIELWDGLLTIGSSTVLIRLARIEGDREAELEVVHELSAGGFDGHWREWTIGDRPHPPSTPKSFVTGTSFVTATSGDLVVVADGVSARAGARSLSTRIRLRHDRWSGVVVGTAQDPPGIEECARLLARAEADEERFVARVLVPRAHASRAFDALRVLRALTDPATGAPVASPTTSLPEAPGAERQFDYRYTWLRDSANASATASLLGRRRASDDYLDFIDVLLDRYGDKLMPLTTTAGEPVPEEREIEGVSGWAGSVPIRVGNSAADQRQLDAVATVIEAISVHVQCGGTMNRARWQAIDRLAGMLVDAPFEATSGIWELRRPKRLVTEELARWIGLDKAIRLQRIFRPWRRRPTWHTARAEARARVESMIDRDSGMIPQSFDGPFVADAATLLACTNGFMPRRSEASRRLALGTISALEEGCFLRRYPAGSDDADSVEGAFVPSSWLAVSALVAAGEYDAARRRADDMCVHLPPLQSEEWCVESDEGLGNTPLLWSHTECARAVYNLHLERVRRRYTSVGLALWRVGRYLRLRFAADR